MNRIQELVEQIKHHNDLYYNKDNPEITDLEYDKLVKELKLIDPQNNIFQDVGKATYGQKFKHQTVMGSLAKCHTVEEIIKKFQGQEVILMPKVDGASLALHYKEGKLIRAVTRGDGYEGEIVTENAKVVQGVPQVINLKGQVEVRGEAYIAQEDFYSRMDQPGYAGMENGMANPRNCAAGALRQKDSSLTAERKVRFVAYKLLGAGANIQCSRVRILGHQGFEVVSIKTIQSDKQCDLQNLIDGEKKAQHPYETDGVVIMLNDLNKFEEEGYSGKCPKGALAFKFDTEKKISTVIGITWQVGRTGKITPVAEIDATHICGSTVRRISLHNLDWLNKMDVAIGDTVKFEKANEIIPEVVEVMSRNAWRHTNQPSKCPACDHPVVVKGAYLQCVNLECPAQVVSHMRFVLETLGVKGLDETTIEKLIECGEVEDIEDLFKLNKDLLVAKGFGEVESKKWVSALNEIKTTPAKLLACLGIQGWGERMFEKLFEQSKLSGTAWVSAFLNDEYNKVDSVWLKYVAQMGEVRPVILLKGIAENKELLLNLLKHITLIEEVIVNGSLTGKSFCITGTLSKGRKEIQEDIKKAGGTIKDSVSKGLDYLVTGEDCGGKIEKAQKLQIKTILESELYKMIGG